MTTVKEQWIGSFEKTFRVGIMRASSYQIDLAKAGGGVCYCVVAWRYYQNLIPGIG